MNEAQRTTAIPTLDELTSKAADLRKEFDSLIDRQHLATAEGSTLASNTSHQLVNTLQRASDALKWSGVARVQSYVTRWSHFRQEDEDYTRPDPVFESITYNDENVWTVVMTTTTHGKERLVVHSDTATWNDVSSATRV